MVKILFFDLKKNKIHIFPSFEENLLHFYGLGVKIRDLPEVLLFLQYILETQKQIHPCYVFPFLN